MKAKIILTLCVISISSAVFAELKPEDKIKFRQSGYTFMRWNMGTIKKQVVDHPESFNKEQVVAAANVIAAVADSGIGTLFGNDTKTGKGWKETLVKPEFFQQPDTVKKYATAFSKEANELAAVSNSGDVARIKTQFDRLLKACKNCHEDFRSKD